MAKVIFISGGVRSGKSRFAEKRATTIAGSGGQFLHYIACGEPSDSEMRERIAHHKRQRAEAPIEWETFECPTAIGNVAPHLSPNGVVLLDCLTTLLSNELFKTGDWSDQAFQEKVMQSIKSDLASIGKRCATLIIVSNELGHEPLKTDLVQVYARLLGELHQWIVEQSNEAYLVENGIPRLMKGEVME
ncbi:bifunctional adenosylcobinamide kinase/adenosylcobinamide-phosphate guanylyltransferase [Guptibacillus hwajinpoensis]|uniref:Adenosylcobinamide kinase n=1 Tax=Guptibacillus hwajinpoensis TaxID=208199 RepID=A0A0J6CKF1_9BACL|nr:bifunctional adenosylcobinamide kinase/adenosylcobinamide-phosphate guanylyltransferase [Alkalihalobacillus macyae]KMM36716.1 hypothetical protein AB986_12280 [Alkalihalobacillus macyae]